MTRIEQIRAKLETELAPEVVEIEDDGARHAGHAGAGRGGHFNVRIVAAAFTGMSALQRHRRVYLALDELMKTDIHALSVKALTPDEVV